MGKASKLKKARKEAQALATGRIEDDQRKAIDCLRPVDRLHLREMLQDPLPNWSVPFPPRRAFRHQIEQVVVEVTGRVVRFRLLPAAAR